jgi:1,4-alpha-glucan branching enzyme
MVYEHSEHFIMPLSHDEMVHLKGSLYGKMRGDHWQRLANLRALYAYQFTRPGKSLLFMGSELAQPEEWDHECSLPWHLQDDPSRAMLRDYVTRLAHVYRMLPALWQHDGEPRGFEWIDTGDEPNSVLSYLRRAGDLHAVVVLNLTPVPHTRYRIGVPEAGVYVRAIGSDDAQWGGSGFSEIERVTADDVPYHGRRYSIELALPPLSAMVFMPERVAPAGLLA